MNGACFHSWNCATAEKQLHVSCAAAFTAALLLLRYTVAFIIVALALALYESSHKALLDSALF